MNSPARWLAAITAAPAILGCAVGGVAPQESARCHVDVNGLWVDNGVHVIDGEVVGILGLPFFCPVGLTTYQEAFGTPTNYAADLRAPFLNHHPTDPVRLSFYDAVSEVTEACGGHISCVTSSITPLLFSWFPFDATDDQILMEGRYWAGRWALERHPLINDQVDSAFVTVPLFPAADALGWVELPYSYAARPAGLYPDDLNPAPAQWVSVSSSWHNFLDPTPYVNWYINDVLQSSHSTELTFLTQAGITYDVTAAAFDSDTLPSPALNTADQSVAIVTQGGGGGGGGGGEDPPCLQPPCP